MRTLIACFVPTLALGIMACSGATSEEISGQTEGAIRQENKIHFGTCFMADDSGVQLQWYREEQRMKVLALPAGRARSQDDFDRSNDVLIDEKLEWYTLESDARARARHHADFAWTAYYNLDDGKTIKVEGAWDRVSGQGYPERFGHFTLTGNGHTQTFACERANLRRPQVVNVLPERLLLPAKDDDRGFVIEETDGTEVTSEWRAEGYVRPRSITFIDGSGRRREAETRGL